MKKVLVMFLCALVGLLLGIYIGYVFHQKQDEHLAISYFATGDEYYEKQLYPEAAEMFNRSLGLDPDLDLSHLRLSSTYRKLNFDKLMIKELEASGLKEPTSETNTELDKR